MANTKASMSEITPISEKYTIKPFPIVLPYYEAVAARSD